MAIGFNHVTLIGNMTKDLELKYTPNGTAVGEIRLAVNRMYTGGDGKKRDETLWIDCVAWGKTAENVAQYCGKGSLILVDGRLQSREWEQKDGQKRSKIEVVADRVQFLNTKKGEGRQPESARHGAADVPADQGGGADGDDDSEVPF